MSLQVIFDTRALFDDKYAFLDGDAENRAVSLLKLQVACNAFTLITRMPFRTYRSVSQ